MKNFSIFCRLLCFCLYTSVLFSQDTLLKVRYVRIPFDVNEITLTPTDFALCRAEKIEIKHVYQTFIDLSYTTRDSLRAYRALKRETRNFGNDFRDSSLFSKSGHKIILNTQKSAPFIHLPIGANISYIQSGRAFVNSSEENMLFVGKIRERKPIPDSVNIRHILFRDSSTLKADNLLKQLNENEITWEQANESFNQDMSSIENGGEIGYVRQYMLVEPFDNLCFDYGIPNKYYRIDSQFGAHVVQVIGRKFTGDSLGLIIDSYKTPVIIDEKSEKQMKAKVQKLIGKCQNIDELEKRLRQKNIEFTNDAYRYTVTIVGDTRKDEVAAWIATAKHGEITKEPIKAYGLNKDQFVIMGMRTTDSSTLSDDELVKRFGYTIDSIQN